MTQPDAAARPRTQAVTMTLAERAGGQAAKWLRWIARGVGAFVAGYWLFIASAYAICGQGPCTGESLIRTGPIAASTAVALIAWRRARIGGTALLVVAVDPSPFALIASDRNRGLAVLISGGPFLVAGHLSLASWWKVNRQGSARNTT